MKVDFSKMEKHIKNADFKNVDKGTPQRFLEDNPLYNDDEVIRRLSLAFDDFIDYDDIEEVHLQFGLVDSSLDVAQITMKVISVDGKDSKIRFYKNLKTTQGGEVDYE